MNGFIMMMRTFNTTELIKDHKAFALLTHIALRARWNKDEFCIHPLEPGQAFIGDCSACGLTPSESRAAQGRLIKYGLAAFKGTNKGTIATLLNREVYNIFGKVDDEQDDTRTTTKQQSDNKPTTSNEDRTKNKKLKPKNVDARGINPPKIEINDYGDIMNPNNPPITVACTVTGECFSSRAAGFYHKAHQAIGDRPFRQAVAELWGEIKVDTIRKPGAVLTNKLKHQMETKSQLKAS
jgi:hypothetical protein